MSRSFLFLGLLLFAANAGFCQQTTDPATKALIQQLLERIEQLEHRVAQLEGKTPEEVSAAPRVSAPPAPSSLSTEPSVQPELAPPAPHLQPVFPSLKLTGFTDVNFAATDLGEAPPEFRPPSLLREHSGFAEGQFVLHLSSALSSKVSVFGELSLTASPAGYSAEVERALIRYQQNDYIGASFGRFHTPINYWNTAFHHGQWLQTSISRPEMTQFGGSFIPVHFVGALVEGAAPAGGLNLNYNFGLGNGRGPVPSRGGDFEDVNNNRAWLVNLFVKPDRFYGLQVGGAVYRDKITVPGGSAVREWIQSGHVVWQREASEVIAEFANVSHGPVDGSVSSNSQAYYIQVARRLPWMEKLWKPYYRFEYIHVPESDAIFRVAVPSFTSSTVGMRYDVSSFAALKLEYRHYRRGGLQNFNGVFMQTSFTF